MLNQYIILRDLAAVRTAGPLASARPSATESSLGAEPVVLTAELTPRELDDAARDPKNRAIAMSMDVMPIRMSAGHNANAAPLAGTATWGVSAVGADRSPMTGKGVVACVLDSGIDAEHPAFAGVDLVVKDFTGSGPGDSDGHGTHCAGTIFGRAVGGTRIGVAPGVERALIGRIFGDNGGGDTAMLVRAVTWAAENGANVLSMSLGFDFERFFTRLEQSGLPRRAAFSLALSGAHANLRLFDSLMTMIRNQGAFGPDMLVVAAAGNESDHPAIAVTTSLPAAADHVVSVGAVGPAAAGKHDVASFSNTNPNMVAPGVDVHSAQAGSQGTVAISGTSMATPHVAGVAALWWQQVRQTAPAGRAIAPTVLARMNAALRRDVLRDGTDTGLFGEGMATAPMG